MAIGAVLGSTFRIWQALGRGEYFAERPEVSLPYCGSGGRMLVFAVLMDKTGLRARQSGIVVVHKPDHQLPMFVLTFDNKAVSPYGGGTYGGANPFVANLRAIFGSSVPPWVAGALGGGAAAAAAAAAIPVPRRPPPPPPRPRHAKPPARKAPRRGKAAAAPPARGMRVAELRAELASLSEDTSGTKPALVSRLETARAASADTDE